MSITLNFSLGTTIASLAEWIDSSLSPEQIELLILSLKRRVDNADFTASVINKLENYAVFKRQP